MSTQSQSGTHPTTPELDRRALANVGAKLLIADWPGGLRGQAMRLTSRVGRFAGWCVGVGEQTLRGERVADGAGVTPAQVRMADRLDAGRWPTMPLRIGVRVGHEFSRRVREAAGSGGVEFVSVASAIGDRAAFGQLNLDALLIGTATGLKIQTREHRERDAGWFDWGSARPLSYLSVFPTRLDVSQVTIDELPGPGQEGEIQLIRALIEAAAVTSRVRARLMPEDRWRGRKAVDRTGVVDDAFSRLATSLQHGSLGSIRSAQRAAARVLSAWAIGAQPGSAPGRQRQLTELCARCIGQEAEVMLRLAAARLADMDDAGGRQALLAADRMLRSRPTLPGVDNGAFVQAELDQGRHDPLAVGRVAAGVVLACAALPVEKLVFTQGDLLEEMRFSQWLVGRDQDRTLLHRLTRELVHQRRAEQMGLPAPVGKSGGVSDTPQSGVKAGRSAGKSGRSAAKAADASGKSDGKKSVKPKSTSRKAGAAKASGGTKSASRKRVAGRVDPVRDDAARAEPSPRSPRKRKAA